MLQEIKVIKLLPIHFNLNNRQNIQKDPIAKSNRVFCYKKRKMILK